MRPPKAAAAWVAAAAALLAVPAVACGAEPAVGELANGLRYCVVPRPGSALTAIDVWVRAGSAYEGPNEAGAAHLLEHMIFKGTPTRGPGGVDLALENMGGVLSAGTLRGFAHFHTVVEGRHVREALGVITDALRHPTLDAVEMERERRVVLAELARRANDGGVAAADAVWAGLFAGSPLASPPSGAVAGIGSLTPEALRRFHSRLYRPDAVCVAMAGGTAPPAATEALEASLGDWAKPAEPAPAPPSVPGRDQLLPRAAANPIGVAVRSGPEGRVWFAAGFALSDGASDLCDRMLALLAADPAVGRMAQAATTAVTGGVSVETSVIAGHSVTVICGADDGPMGASPLAAIRTTLQGIVDRPPDAAEVAGIRARLLGLRLFELETCAGSVRAAGLNLALGRPVNDLSLRQGSSAVTGAQIAARAAEWLTKAVRAEAVAHSEAAP
jgi:predicted Zn-dependent peptidase